MINYIKDNKFFISILLAKLALIVAIYPPSVQNMYYPFLEFSINNFNIDPWTAWLKSGGEPNVFPYGYAMWIALLPAAILSKLNIDFNYLYGFTLLIIDFSFLFLLNKIYNNKSKYLKIFYWASPIIIFSNYIFGLNDIIAIYFLAICFFYIKKNNFFISGFFLIISISAKLSMIIAVPFFIIYFYRNKSVRLKVINFLYGTFLSSILFILPSIASSGNLDMVFFLNQEIDKIYQFAISIDNNYSVYIIPLIYILLVYYTYCIRRLHFDLLVILISLSFLLVALFSPSSTGWLVWAIILLVVYQFENSLTERILVMSFSIIYILNSLFVTPNLIPQILQDNLFKFSFDILNITLSIQFAIGIIIAVRIANKMINNNDSLRLSRKPFSIGISGDSGSGKDTLSNSLINLFGKHSVTHLSGDDYHIWDRNEKMWNYQTHLNPSSNDLNNFFNDIKKLVNRKKINKRIYDHNSGKRSVTSNLNSNDYIIASGLHTLYHDQVKNLFDLTIFLDMDDELRLLFKINRDKKDRGKTKKQVLKSIEDRETDSKKYISPQKENADIIFSLMPNKKIDQINFDKTAGDLKLKITTKSTNNYRSLIKILVARLGMNCEYNISDNGKVFTLICQGYISALDINKAAVSSFPRLEEFLDINQRWSDNSLGLMQFITLFHINESINQEAINL